MNLILLPVVLLTLLPFLTQSIPIDDKAVKAEEIEYSLPKTVTPIKYKVNLELLDDAFETNKFSGAVEIELKIVESVSEIQLHSRELELSDIKILNSEEGEISLKTHVFNNGTDILTVPRTTGQFIKDETYIFSANFVGTFSPIDMHGLYKSSYLNEAGETEYLATTQFEPTHARRVFPCFDEPEFKATFDISITVPNEYTAMTNGKLNVTATSDGQTTFTFETSPKMSTYLNAFIISKFICSNNQLSDGTVHQICSRKGTEKTQVYALDVGAKIMTYLEKYTDIKYSEYGPLKMDQVAIPDFSAGAMENWGLVTYRETGLLWVEVESTNMNKQRLAAVVAHEFAHMWFGNLVTCKWWSNLFLQEGFARYFQYFGTAEVETNWELDKQFVIEQVQTALSVDSSSSSNALSSIVRSPSEISGRFDSISYNKGATIYRMIYHLIGEDNFRNGLREYLKNNALGSTEPQNLWKELSLFANSLPHDFEEIMKNWTEEPGYPVVMLTLEGDKVIASQERFLLSGNADKTKKWFVPISYTLSSDTNKFENTVAQKWLTPNSDTETLVEDVKDWIILNNQQSAYYRVYYDDNLLNRIISALNNNITVVHVLNRAQIIDDLFNLARSGRHTYSKVFAAVSFLKNEEEYYPWYSAITGFSYVLQRIGDENVYNAFSSHIAKLLENLYKSTPFNKLNPSDHGYTLKQVLAINWACGLGNKDCIENAQKLFQYINEENKPNNINTNLRAMVYCTALRHSNNSADWEFLWNKFVETKLATEEITILSALGCSTNETLLNKLLTNAFDETGPIRRQDISTALSSVYNNNPSGIMVTFRFITEHLNDVIKYYQSESSAISVLRTLAARFTKQEQIDELQTFVNNNNDLSDESKNSLEASITSSTSNLEITNRIQTEINQYLKDDDNSGTRAQFGYALLTSLVIICYQIML